MSCDAAKYILYMHTTKQKKTRSSVLCHTYSLYVVTITTKTTAVVGVPDCGVGGGGVVVGQN